MIYRIHNPQDYFTAVYVVHGSDNFFCLFSDYEDMNRRELLAAVIDLQRVRRSYNSHLCATSYKGNIAFVGGVIKPYISKILNVQESQRNSYLNIVTNGTAFFLPYPSRFSD